MAIYHAKCGARVGVTGPCRACKKQDTSKIGPVETLARLCIQSDRYQADPDYRDAVDAVLGHPVYDAGPKLLIALKNLVARVEHNGGIGEYTGGPAFVMGEAKTAIHAAGGKP